MQYGYESQQAVGTVWAGGEQAQWQGYYSSGQQGQETQQGAWQAQQPGFWQEPLQQSEGQQQEQQQAGEHQAWGAYSSEGGGGGAYSQGWQQAAEYGGASGVVYGYDGQTSWASEWQQQGPLAVEGQSEQQAIGGYGGGAQAASEGSMSSATNEWNEQSRGGQWGEVAGGDQSRAWLQQEGQGPAGQWSAVPDGAAQGEVACGWAPAAEQGADGAVQPAPVADTDVDAAAVAGAGAGAGGGSGEHRERGEEGSEVPLAPLVEPSINLGAPKALPHSADKEGGEAVEEVQARELPSVSAEAAAAPAAAASEAATAAAEMAKKAPPPHPRGRFSLVGFLGGHQSKVTPGDTSAGQREAEKEGGKEREGGKEGGAEGWTADASRELQRDGGKERDGGTASSTTASSSTANISAEVAKAVMSDLSSKRSASAPDISNVRQHLRWLIGVNVHDWIDGWTDGQDAGMAILGWDRTEVDG